MLAKMLLGVIAIPFTSRSAIVYPIEKAISKLLGSSGFGWKWIGSFHHRSQFQARYLQCSN
jgi:hypothetical protein